MGPTMEGVGLNITVFSYRGSVDFGFMVDRDLVPDVWNMADRVSDALAELQEAAGITPTPVVDEDPTTAPADGPTTGSAEPPQGRTTAKRTAAKRTTAKRTAAKRPTAKVSAKKRTTAKGSAAKVSAGKGSAGKGSGRSAAAT